MSQQHTDCDHCLKRFDIEFESPAGLVTEGVFAVETDSRFLHFCSIECLAAFAAIEFRQAAVAASPDPQIDPKEAP